MIYIERVFSDKYIDRGEFVHIVEELTKIGYSPLFYNLSESIAQILNLPFVKDDYSDTFFNLDEYPYKSKIEVEVFVKDDILFYIIKGDPSYKAAFLDIGAKEEPFLEFGVIGVSTQIFDELDIFVSFFKKIRQKFEDEKYSEIDSDYEFDIFSISNYLDIEYTITKNYNKELKFVKPDFNTEELIASQFLCTIENRNLLIYINSKKTVLEELLFKKNFGIEDLAKIIDDLTEKKLLQKKCLIQCRKTSKIIAEFDDTIIEDGMLKNLKCYECGKSYFEESKKNGYSLTIMGRELLHSSKWMTIIVSNRLKEEGIPEEDILWNIEWFDDEIDLIIQFRGNLFILELKDKAFGSGNAHTLDFRRKRFNANKAVIITTEMVSKDAKNVFREIMKSYEGGDCYKLQPIYIENFNEDSSVLDPIFQELLQFETLEKIKHIESITGFNLINLIDKKFGSSLGLLDSEYDDFSLLDDLSGFN